MNYFDSVSYLYALGNEMRGAKLGLERMQLLLEEMDHPEWQGRIVHVAGTNGKGSTSAMIAAGLHAAGLKAGLFTSPHLQQPTERICINGTPVGREEFSHAFDVVHKSAEQLLESGAISVHPSYFETVTLMAFHIFKQHRVDAVVYEVGLGGRLDATNVVMPEVAVITPVDYDHEQFLGSSIAAIAGEKAGILKAGRPVVVAKQRGEAMGVIQRRAGQLGCHIYSTYDWLAENVQLTERGCHYEVGKLQIDCPLAGDHQLENSLTAAMALQVLGIENVAIEKGIAGTIWPGRLEHISKAPHIILDGAHNPAGARALADYIKKFFTGKRVGLIFGAMRDKSMDELAAILFPLAGQLILTSPNLPRALRPEALLEFASHPNVVIRPHLADAIAAIADVDVTFITGSLYLVGEARSLLIQ